MSYNRYSRWKVGAAITSVTLLSMAVLVSQTPYLAAEASELAVNVNALLGSIPSRLVLLAVSLVVIATAFAVGRHHLRATLEVTPQALTSAPMARSMDGIDREFLPAALELYETPPSPINVAGIWFICIAFAVSLAWAYFGWLEIYAVAQGRIQPSGHSKVVQPLEPGRVDAILVKNGDHVAQGDVLVELDATETQADRQEQARDLETMRAEIARRKVAIAAADNKAQSPAAVVNYQSGTNAEIRLREDAALAADLAQLKATRESLKAQYAEHIATRDRFTASITAREKLLSLYKERASMRETLEKTGATSRAQVIEVEEQYETLATTQVGEKGQLSETEASLQTLQRKLDETTAQFIADQTQHRMEAESRADRLDEELIKAQFKSERTKITAPIDGTVQQLAVTTIGQVVASAEPLMTIVPSDAPIEIEAMIQNQDIGFVESGQPAVVKVESFPYTRYGTIDGSVLHVSRDAMDQREADALADAKTGVRPRALVPADDAPATQSLVFPAVIRLDRNVINVDGKDVPLTPGMAVTVEIKTGQRRALDYVLSPLREVTSTSAHER